MIYLFVLAIVPTWFWVGLFVWPIDFRHDRIALTYDQFKNNWKLHLLRLCVLGPLFAWLCIFCFLLVQTHKTLSLIIDSIDKNNK